jgi:carbon monoxide dehydrogenase subunit G
MEVKIEKRYPVEVDPVRAWAVLSDVLKVAGCMPGAQITEKIDDTHYKGKVKAKVGPAVMSFDGQIEVLGIDADALSIQLAGKGADRSGSSASMKLTARIENGEAPGSSVLAGQAVIGVSGKLAQFGNRLIVPVSDAMLGQFADNFRAAASAMPVTSAQAAGDPPPGGSRWVPDEEEGFGPSSSASVAAAPAKELNALGLLWTAFKNWFAGLFRRPS